MQFNPFGVWTLAALLTYGTVWAQIRTDGSLGQLAQTLTGPSYVIPQSLGKLAGNNLFHSFQTFSVNTGESAHFTTTTPGLSNVITRVTGGTPSQINGPLVLTANGATPNFYFINPAGVAFGAGASVDVPGALHVSTAHSLKFADGIVFAADAAAVSTLSSAEPAAFGFLGTSRSAIVIKDAVLQNAAGGIALVASDLTIDHAGLWTETGSIRLAALGADPAEWSLSGAAPVARGTLDIRNGASVVTAATTQSQGGNIAIAAGAAIIQSGAGVFTTSATAQRAGSIRAELANLEIDGRAAPESVTGITSVPDKAAPAAGGDVTVIARGAIRILGGGILTSDTYGQGAAGSVTVQAGSLLLDGSGHPNSARITNRGKDGNAGMLDITVTDTIDMVNGSQISGSSFGSGQAGSVHMQAAGDMRILSDSFVSSDAFAKGDAGSISIATRNLTIDGGGDMNTQVSSQARLYSSGNAGAIRITTPGTLKLLNGGRITTDTYSAGKAGDITINSGSLWLDGGDYSGFTGIFSAADPDVPDAPNPSYTTGDAGTVTVNVTGDAQIFHHAEISSTAWSVGHAGNVVFKAKNLLIDGKDNPDGGAGISSEAFSSGDGGSVSVEVAQQLSITGSGWISASTLAQGNAGSVFVKAGQLTLDGGSQGGFASIESRSVPLVQDPSGNAGPISVVVAGNALLTRNGRIRSDAQSMGRAGDVSVQVGGNLTIEEGAYITSNTYASGLGGNIAIEVAGSLDVGTNGTIYSATQGAGHAGNMDISARQITLASSDKKSFAWIFSDTRGSGTAGAIKVSAGKSLVLADGGFITSDSYASGHSGSIVVSAPSIQIGGVVQGAAISSDAYASGNAGRVEVNGQTVRIQGGSDTLYATGITSASHQSTSTGNAGTVMIHASDALELEGGGVVTSSTAGAGHGGEVQIQAGAVRVRGTDSQIGAVARANSTGQPGSVTVRVDGELVLASGGSLSIKNDGTSSQPSEIAPSMLTVQAAQLRMDAGSIQANSTRNVAAGSVQIDVSERLSLTRSSISTSTNSGNGGDIHVNTQALVLQTGFIQANTAASMASGGLVGIKLKALVPSGNTLQVGGQSVYDFAPDVFGFNVIQAAAPTGVSGTIDISSPALDVSGGLIGLQTVPIDVGGLGRSPCQISAGSSLAQAGRGGLPPSARGLLRVEPVAHSARHWAALDGFVARCTW